DFVLFSMHQVEDKEFWTGDFHAGRTQEEYNRRYYEEILETMRLYKDYSVLAHLDLIVRYDEQGVFPFEKVRDIVAAILELAIKEDKGIEMNTSSWKYGLSDTQPSRAILRLYKDLGGKIITIGSDAHKKEYLGYHFEDACAILKDEIGFENVATFEKMEPVFHKLE
ncbi:MAG: histidinol-phosphatase HisJ family protein, partial [Lachnospiraceae bacterium]|nr:histidinol-phosphatase HisJ family protein [Lachnospiraceae bacterium]